MRDLDNPYWTKLLDLQRRGAVQYDQPTNSVRPVPGAISTVRMLAAQYSRTITDPVLIEYVVKVVKGDSAVGNVVEVDAGMGYWSKLLTQCDVTCTAYDLQPPVAAWHRPIYQQQRSRTDLRIHRLDTLVCMEDAWPFNSFVQALKQYPGDRFLLAAERHPTTAYALNEILERAWNLGSEMQGLRILHEPRAVYEYQRRTTWNQATKMMPIYVPKEEAT